MTAAAVRAEAIEALHAAQCHEEGCRARSAQADAVDIVLAVVGRREMSSAEKPQTLIEQMESTPEGRRRMARARNEITAGIAAERDKALDDLVAALARVEGVEKGMTALADELDKKAERARELGAAARYGMMPGPAEFQRGQALVNETVAQRIHLILAAPLPSVDGTGDKK